LLRFRGMYVRSAGQFLVTVVTGAQIAHAAVGIPMEAMNVGRPPELVYSMTFRHRPETSSSIAGGPPAPRMAPGFFISKMSTGSVRKGFELRHELDLEIAQEQYFRTIPYGSIIYREARKNNLPPELVAAVIQAESDFRPNLVISQHDATGLMQIVPENDIFNPETNIGAGAKYLRYLLDRFGDGNTALAAYNAGEGNVEKFGGVPPFSETLAYLRRVRAHSRSYRSDINTVVKLLHGIAAPR
jgi:hypothetical protein